MLDKFTLTIPSLEPEMVRRAYIYIPDSIISNSSLRFPVLYMFDGQNVFFDEDATYGKSWGIKEYLDYTQTQMIVAAIESNYNPGNDRLCEYSPCSFENDYWGKVDARGDLTMDYIINDFKKMIDSHYPTLPDRKHTWIAGSSMGGLMSYYSVIRYNDVFSKAACLSPSFWVGIDQLESLLDKCDIDPYTFIYMDYGQQEVMNPKSRHYGDEFWRIAKALADHDIATTARIIPNGNHSEASWERQVPYFMSLLKYDEDN